MKKPMILVALVIAVSAGLASTSRNPAPCAADTHHEHTYCRCLAR